MEKCSLLTELAKCSQNTKKNKKTLKVSFKAIFNVHFANLVSKNISPYNVLQFSCCMNN